MSSRRILHGRCRCGTVRYEVPDAFLYATNCHCADCRAATGAAFKPLAGIEAEKVRLTLGQEKLLIYTTGPNSDVRCAVCGSYLYARVGSRLVHISLGTLCDTPSIRPTEHIFVESKAPWFTIADDLPQYARHVADGPPINR